MSDYTGIQKRMRKGTKSCLPCRHRKIKCSGAGDNGQPCKECELRKDTCVAQGKVLDDSDAVNQRLQERVAMLEARLRELTRSPSSCDTAHIGQNSIASPSGHSTKVREVDDGGRYDTPSREAIDANTAPLMYLLSNKVLGTSSEKPRPATDEHASNNTIAVHKSAKHDETVRNMCQHMPSTTEMTDIFDNSSTWWELYREALGLAWAGDDHMTLPAFAMHVLTERSPPMLGLLLVCFAISTGDIQRYLPPVEKHIVHDDEYAASEGGLNCLMALGLCYMSSLQPRRAWMIHRRANSLIQLNGIHIRHKSPKHERLFWQLFQADRWVSLMIGLPYMMPDQLCDLTIPPLAELDEGIWLYRHLGVITGRVVDCLQSATGATLSATLHIEEEMEKIKVQLSHGYLELSSIRNCEVSMKKYVRLYGVVHFYQLRAFIHLPFLLRSATQERLEFSRKSCIDDARRLLEAYLEIYDSEPSMVTNGTVLNFNVFVSAGIILLGLIGYGRPTSSEHILSQSQTQEDWHIFHRVMEVLKQGAKDKGAGMLCQTCYTALEKLLESAKAGPSKVAQKVVLPYFGTLSITHHGEISPEKEYVNAASDGARQEMGTSQADRTMDILTDPSFGHGMEFAYTGPFLPDGNNANWMFTDSFATQQVDFGVGADWFGTSGNLPPEWNWLDADLPPNISL